MNNCLRSSHPLTSRALFRYYSKNREVSNSQLRQFLIGFIGSFIIFTERFLYESTKLRFRDWFRFLGAARAGQYHYEEKRNSWRTGNASPFRIHNRFRSNIHSTRLVSEPRLAMRHQRQIFRTLECSPLYVFFGCYRTYPSSCDVSEQPERRESK